jgi:signal transduction histidine kinase
LAWFQGKYESLKNVGYFERIVLGSISLRHWYVNMVDSVNRMIETECVVGYMLDDGLGAFLPQAWSSLDQEGAIRSMRGEKKDLIDLMKERKGIVFRDSLFHDLPEERARKIDGAMEILNAHLCAPFSDGQRIVGFITVGKKIIKSLIHFKADEVHFELLRKSLDLLITRNKNKITLIDLMNKQIDPGKGPFGTSDKAILETHNGLVNDVNFLRGIDLNLLTLRSEGFQMLKKHQDGGRLTGKEKLTLHTAIIRSILKDEIGPGPEDLINAEDIDALSLLFTAGQETLMVMTTAVTQQKRSAEWAHDLRQPFDKGNFQLINDLSSGKLGPVNAEQKQALFAMREDAEFVRKKLESLINPQADDLRMENVDVGILLQIFTLKNKTLCAHHQINLSVNLPPQMTRIRCDAEILNFRVLGNLCDNAIRHTPPGGNIHVGVQMREDTDCTFTHQTSKGWLPFCGQNHRTVGRLDYQKVPAISVSTEAKILMAD